MKWVRMLAFCLLFCFLLKETAFAGETEKAGLLSEMEKELLSELKLDELDETLKTYQEKTGLNFSETVKMLIKGEIPWSGETAKTLIFHAFFEEIADQKKHAAAILLLLAGAAVFSGAAGIFEKNLASVLAGKSAGGTAFCELILGTLTVLQWLVKTFLLPGVQFYFLLTLLDHMFDEAYLSKMAGLIKSFVEWTLKTLTGTVAGLQVFQSLILPAVDALKNTVIQKSGGSIPVVGGLFDQVTEMVLGAALLIRNGVGVAGLLVLVILCLTPLVKLLAGGCLYRLLSAITQPVADKRLTECVDGLGQSVLLLLKIFLFTGILFFLSLALALAA